MGIKWKDELEAGELHNEEPLICAISSLVEKTNYASAKRKIFTEYWWGELKEKNKLKDVDIDG